MKDKLFDNYIKETLYHTETAVPADMWERIAKEKDTKRPVFFWLKNPKTYLLFTIGVALVLSSFYYLNQNNFNKDLVSTNSYQNQKKTINNSTSDFTVSDDLSIEKKEKTNIAELELAKEKNKEITTSQTLIKNKSVSKNNSTFYKKTTLQKSKIKSSEKPILFENNNNDIELFLLTNSIVTKAELAKFTNNIESKNLTENKNNSNTQFFTKSGKEMFAINQNPPIVNLRKLFGLDDCPNANGNFRNDLYIEAYTSADYTMKRINNTGTSELYLAKKDSAEKMIGGFSVGLRVSKSLNEKLLLKSGLQFTQMFEKFNLTKENERKITTTIVTRTIVRPGLTDTTISDTSRLIQIGYVTQSNLNLYKSFEMPILLSYEFGNHDSKYKFAFTGGVILNLTTWNKGNTINELNEIVSINSKSDNNNFYNHQIGLSAYLSASIIRQLNDKWAVFVEPYGRFSLGKSNLAAGFVQQFDAVGIQFGTRINLNR